VTTATASNATQNESMPTTTSNLTNAAHSIQSTQHVNSRATYYPTQPERVYFEHTNELNPPPPSYAEITKDNARY